MARHPFAAVNLISDPIHGYVELTKRLGAGRVGRRRAAGRGRRRGGPPRHRLGPAAAPDQPAPERPLGLPDRRALAVHPRPRRHARGRCLGPVAVPIAPARRSSPRARRSRRRGSSSRPCGSPGSSTTSATGRSPTSSTTTSCPASRRRPTRGGAAGKRLSHEDLSQLIVERELGPLIRALRRAPGERAGARRLRRRRVDRPALGVVPRLEAGPRRRGDAALGSLAPAAAVGRLHRRQPRLRPARRLHDRRRASTSTSSGCGATRSSGGAG